MCEGSLKLGLAGLGGVRFVYVRIWPEPIQVLPKQSLQGHVFPHSRVLARRSTTQPNGIPKPPQQFVWRLGVVDGGVLSMAMPTRSNA